MKDKKCQLEFLKFDMASVICFESHEIVLAPFSFYTLDNRETPCRNLSNFFLKRQDQ